MVGTVYIREVTFIALPLVSMGSNNAANDANTVTTMNKLIVTIVLEASNVCKRMKHIDIAT